MIVNELPIGAKFTYKLRTYKVLRHEYEDYPSVVCECLDGDKELIGTEVEFANMEEVEPVF